MLRTKKRLWIEILLHGVFWAGVGYVLTSLNSSHIHVLYMKHGFNAAARAYYQGLAISPYVYIILTFLMVLFYGNIFWVFRKVVRYKNGMVRVAICAAWFTLIFGANYFIAGPLFDRANEVTALHTPLLHPTVPGAERRIILADRPPAAPNAINFITSDWWHIQPVILFAFLVILGISIAYFFLNAWAKSELIKSRLQADQLSTEIKFLKSQINPHFLFNTLNNLFSMAQSKGNDELADGISKLSGMMRYMLYDSNEERVPLSKEITYLEECITLNKLRYADEEVTVTFDQAGPIADVSIAPMLFIPFVENAFKHGVAIGQRAAIQIALAVSGQKLIFSCINTDYGSIRKMEMEISGIGLENVKRRLELVYPDKHRLKITNEDGKFMVNLEIDLS
jgi:two-component system LytT family sensor kinase